MSKRSLSKNRQLRLPPDLQKRAEEERKLAETERKAAEMHALEVEALRKQIAAMEEEKQQLSAKANEAGVLAADLQLLQTKFFELRKPWWKKWLLPRTVERDN